MFYEKHMILSPSKYHYLLLGGQTQVKEIESSRNETLNLCQNDLTFGVHIKSLCRKAAQKLHALARINKYPSYEQKLLLLVNSVVKFQVTYCPLI